MLLESLTFSMHVLWVFLIFFVWFLHARYTWYSRVISKNPDFITGRTIIQDFDLKAVEHEPPNRLVAPRATLKQYLKYLYLACVPFVWSFPVKLSLEYFSRFCECKLTNHQKRQLLGKMILETSLVLLFKEKIPEDVYVFSFQNIRLPSLFQNGYQHITMCIFTIIAKENEEPVLKEIIIDGNTVADVDAMFSFFACLWGTYTHNLTHVEAGNIAEVNIKNEKYNLPGELKQSVDDMHSVVSGMNESANHYPADLWQIPREHLQHILGYNSCRPFANHRNISQCMKVSKFVSFAVKARKIYQKHLTDTGVPITTFLSNTIFHSIDHYNLGKYMVHEKEAKSYLGVDSRMISSILGDLNYDLGRWQAMKYTRYPIWKTIYLELREIDEYLADKVHMFVSI